ncbi:MAG: hypothetical protein JO360_02810 [Acidobacteria bacterium]|nr:hypothetical protein [Acidobacteriota bacterium]
MPLILVTAALCFSLNNYSRKSGETLKESPAAQTSASLSAPEAPQPLAADAQSKGAEQQPREIIERMVNQYWTLASFETHGRTSTTYVFPDHDSRQELINFDLSFRQPGEFHFDWQYESGSRLGNRRSLQCPANPAPESATRKRSQSGNCILSTISKASSESLGVPYLAGYLLSKSNLDKLALTGLSDLRMQESERINNTDCYVISGVKDLSGLKMGPVFCRLWIGKNDSLIYQLEEKIESPEATVITRETYQDIKFQAAAQ